MQSEGHASADVGTVHGAVAELETLAAVEPASDVVAAAASAVAVAAENAAAVGAEALKDVPILEQIDRSTVGEQHSSCVEQQKLDFALEKTHLNA